jgi:hypothetical protein
MMTSTCLLRHCHRPVLGFLRPVSGRRGEELSVRYCTRGQFLDIHVQKHGAAKTSCRGECPQGISHGSLCLQDAVAVWEALLGEEKLPTVIVGHSMGGAIATWAASLQVGRVPPAMLQAPSVAATPRKQCHQANRACARKHTLLRTTVHILPHSNDCYGSVQW